MSKANADMKVVRGYFQDDTSAVWKLFGDDTTNFPGPAGVGVDEVSILVGTGEDRRFVDAPIFTDLSILD